MTLLRDLVELPEQVTRGDFVLELSKGVTEPDSTIRDYVVTPQLRDRFYDALTFIKGAVEGRKSRGTYLDGSFGSGKSHFMAMLHLLLQGNLQARSVPELAKVVTQHDPWMQGKKFLLVPYHMIGATTLEEAIFGGYVRHVHKLHPNAATPAVFQAQELVANADQLRAQLGDDKFFDTLNQSKGGDADGWGDLGVSWSAQRYDAAKTTGPGSSEYGLLSADLIDAFFQSIRRQGDYVRIDEGLAVMSAHAKSLGYDAVILFLDEMILWLASKAGNVEFLTSEVPKISKLVESEAGVRAIPVISFIARQRDLRDLIGEHVTGAQSLNFADQLKFWEGRFGKIALEDTNLPFIAERRVLRAKSPEARTAIDAEFERTAQLRQEVFNALLTSQSDAAAFRRLYPFSPALVETLVAVSSLLQRERTALKIMLQLLVEQKDTLALGQLVPVGDLYDQIAQGDEAFSADMKNHFDTAHRLYRQQLRPMLEESNGITFEEAEALALTDPKRRALINDDRLIKTLLLAALAPAVESLRNLTAPRLAALNHGTIKSPIPGQEASMVLGKLRQWASRVGQIKISDGTAQSTVSIQLSGVDVEGILAKASSQDNLGNRIRLIRSTLLDLLGISESSNLWIEHRFRWRGTERRCKVFFSNIREAEDDTLAESGEEWRFVIDYPLDSESRGPRDDIARLDKFRGDRGGTRTIAWIPSFFSSQSLRAVGQLVLLEHITAENRFNDYVRDLSPVDRESARSILNNKRDALRQQLLVYLGVAYGLQNDPGGVLDGMHSLSPDEHFQSLSPGLDLHVPGETHLGPAMVDLLSQALVHQFPAHPRFEDDLKITKANVQKVLDVVAAALRTKERRIHVEKLDRAVVRQIANPLKLGEMGENHFVAGERWKDHFHRSAARGAGLDQIRVRDLRAWIDEPEAMGLPPLLQDLIILSFAEQTNRACLLHGGPMRPELGRVSDDAVLRQQDLPEESEWQTALELAQSTLGTSGFPTFLSGQGVITFSNLAKEAQSHLVESARQLCAELERRAADFGCKDDAAFDRLVTARDGVKILDIIRSKSDSALIKALAQMKLTAAPDAVGTSLKKAGSVSASLSTCDITAIESAAQLPGNLGEKGVRLRDDLIETFRRNEYAVPFVAKFEAVNHEAIQILTSLVPKASPEEKPAQQSTLPTTLGENRQYTGVRTKSQVSGDDLPGWLPANLHSKVLAQIELIDSSNESRRVTLVVTKNLEAILSGASDARFHAATSRILVPSLGIECPVITEP